jgi:hypothetical protein
MEGKAAVFMSFPRYFVAILGKMEASGCLKNLLPLWSWFSVVDR